MRFAKTLTLFAATAIMATANVPAAFAQNEGYNMPSDTSFLTDTNPNMRRAIVRVNGNIITNTDVETRIALIVASNDVDVPEDELDRLRVQVLRNLIDETLQVQEAAALEMAVTVDEVNQAYERFAVENFGRPVEEMDEYLYSIDSSPRSLKRQIQGELAWDRLLRRNITPFVNVSAEEVNEILERIRTSRGTTEYRIGEIYLSANTSTQDAVIANAQQIVEQLRQGGSFVAYARQFSEASTRSVGGDLGWIQLGQLQNPTLEAVAREMAPGQLAGPIEIPGGFSIMLMIDRRQIGMADPRDAILNLKQISLDFQPGMPESEAQLRADQFGLAMQNVTSCANANVIAADIGAEVVDNEQIAVRALPDALQSVLLDMQVGQATPPFGMVTEGVRVLMLCGRDDPAEQTGPSFEDIMSQTENERINRRAQSYLRDLRRDAVISYN